MLASFDLISLHKEYGYFLGDMVNQFLEGSQYKADLISSHGHTIFHRPSENYTFQLGDGSCLASKTGITTVWDIRSQDVALGGQGAPLVPVGDEYLFPEYDLCLNLGGFANISFKSGEKRLAYDICPVNIVINHYSKEQGLEFDKDGDLARFGSVNNQLLNELDNLKYYQLNFPKSLGKEWLTENFLPLVEKYDLGTSDKLRTVYEHIVNQLTISLSIEGKNSILITGGGAYNKFLIQLLSEKKKFKKLVIPEDELVDFKEAIIFGLLGILRFRNEINCFCSVTGARNDCSGGVISICKKH